MSTFSTAIGGFDTRAASTTHESRNARPAMTSERRWTTCSADERWPTHRRGRLDAASISCEQGDATAMCLTCGCMDAHKKMGEANIRFEDVKQAATENKRSVAETLRIME